jgi:hypothetical protein
MYKAVIAWCNLHLPVLSTLGAFAGLFTKLKDLVSQIDTAAKTRNNAGAGTYDARDSATESLIDVLIEVAGSLFSYACEKNLADVKAISDVRPSKLEDMPKVELEQKAADIAALAQKYAADIVNYGTDAAKIAELNTMITTFSESEDAVDTGKGTRAGAVKSLGSLIASTDTLLKEPFDKMMLNIKRTHPDVYAEYLAARTLYDRGGAQSEDAAPAVTTKTNIGAPASAPAK